MSALFATWLLFSSTAEAAPHVFDLAAHVPPRLAIMFTSAWFGVPAADPQGGGVDPGWGNWQWSAPACGLASDPATCAPFGSSGLQRVIASRRRPLAGIYSSSGRTEESLRRVDLMLATARRPCDAGARFDSFAIQLDSLKFTSRHPQNAQSATWDLAYRALEAFLARGDAAHLNGAVTVANDATVYWHFGAAFGLTTQAQRLAALQDDVAEMAQIATQHPSALSVNGRPLLVFYVDSALASAAEWQGVLDGARATSGVDFYALATTLQPAYLPAFDALAPWLNLGVWGSATGADLHARAVDYATKLHAALLGAVAQYPGRVVFGGVNPGFDDFTEGWGQCTMREMPRDPALLAGQLDWLASQHIEHVMLETWDDWTEGSEFEPDVTDGPAKLLELRAGLGALFGEAADPAGDHALAQRWNGYGQARNCCFVDHTCPDGGVAAPPPVAVACSGSVASFDASPGYTSRDVSADAGAPPVTDGGGCSSSGRPASPAPLACLLVLLALRTRRRITTR
jgi:hypothetical protein